MRNKYIQLYIDTFCKLKKVAYDISEIPNGIANNDTMDFIN